VIKTGSNTRKTTCKELHYKIGDKTLTSMPTISKVAADSMMMPLYTH
jgi:hypothetical protein